MQSGDSVRDDGHCVELEDLGDIVSVVGNLVEGMLDREMWLPRILEFEQNQGEAVDEDQNVGTAIVLA
jgi:hypothetical protein